MVAEALYDHNDGAPQLPLARHPPPPTLNRDRHEVTRLQQQDKWLYTCRGDRLTCNTQRVDPLWIVCLRSLLRNIDRVSAEDMQAIPRRLLHLMWNRILSAELDSIAVWCLFAPALKSSSTHPSQGARHVSIGRDHRPRHQAADAPPLETYTRRIHSPASAWLVRLAIADRPCSAADLSAIAGLTNLASLAIRHVPDFDDRVVRAWARLARGADDGVGVGVGLGAPRCFQRLRELELCGVRAVTMEAFDYLCDFPRLSRVLAAGTGMGERRKRRRAESWVSGLWRGVDAGSVSASELLGLTDPVLCFGVNAWAALPCERHLSWDVCFVRDLDADVPVVSARSDAGSMRVKRPRQMASRRQEQLRQTLAEALDA